MGSREDSGDAQVLPPPPTPGKAEKYQDSSIKAKSCLGVSQAWGFSKPFTLLAGDNAAQLLFPFYR